MSGYKNIEEEKKEIKFVFHHEFYHVIDSTLSLLRLDEKWESFNEVDYSNKKVAGGLEIDTSVKGFISRYARNNAAEDKAELFAFMIVEHNQFKEAVAGDEILLKKLQLMISRLKKVSPEINKKFWARLKKDIPY